jgi:hypothetical protein
MRFDVLTTAMVNTPVVAVCIVTPYGVVENQSGLYCWSVYHHTYRIKLVNNTFSTCK